jgi:hypothetical protein
MQVMSFPLHDAQSHSLLIHLHSQGIIVDRVAVPPEHSSDFSERLLYLPRSFFLAEDYTFHKPSNQKSSNSHVSEAQHATSSIIRSRHLAGDDDGPVLACFNSLYKVTRPCLICVLPRSFDDQVDRSVFSLWCRVLRNVSSSAFPRLWLMGIPPHGKSRWGGRGGLMFSTSQL